MPAPTEKDTLSIPDLPGDERPRERLLRHGAASLSNAELLAILLRTGTARENALQLAQRVLARFDGLPRLAAASAADFQQFKGLGEAKTAQILAAIELGKRIAARQSIERPVIQDASDAAQLVADLGYLQQEHVRVILLDASRRLMIVHTVYVGTLNATILRISELFREAIARNSAALILAHNHPSGDPTPSPEDVRITRMAVEAGHLLDIPVLDHLILAEDRWLSLRELGLGFEDQDLPV